MFQCYTNFRDGTLELFTVHEYLRAQSGDRVPFLTFENASVAGQLLSLPNDDLGWPGGFRRNKAPQPISYLIANTAEDG